MRQHPDFIRVFPAFLQDRREGPHLAMAFCRALNIPARYCTGYLGDVGTPPPFSPGDFAAWFEAYLGGQWYTFDARNNMPRIGRVFGLRPQRLNALNDPRQIFIASFGAGVCRREKQAAEIIEQVAHLVGEPARVRPRSS